MKKRIFISVSNDLSIDQRVSRVANTLTEAGYEVIVVGRKRKASVPLSPKPYREHRLRLGVETGPLFYLMLNLKMFLFFMRHRGDIYLANDMDTLLPNFLAAKLKGKRLLYDSHEYWTEMPELISRPRIRKVWYRLERWMFPKVEKAATVNQSIADIYAEKYGKEVVSIRNLPILKPMPAPKKGPEPLIIYQGALNLGRGLDLLLDAMVHLPNYRLWILGYGPVDLLLRQQAKDLDLMDRVKFFGMVPYEELHPLTQQASLGLSIEEDRGASYHLALPNKLFDYIQAGVPVLVSDLPEMKRVVEDYGVGEVLLAEERTPEGLAHRIKGLIEGEHWHKYYEAVLASREHLCWDQEKEQLFKFIRSST